MVISSCTTIGGPSPAATSPERPGGDEVLHSEGLGTRATGWAWQFAIFAVGALPAVGTIVFVSTHPGGTDTAGG